MEYAQKVVYLLDKHHMTLSKTNNRLLLEIETKSTGRYFSLELENDAIFQASNETFSDVNTMLQGLEDALKKIYKEVTISFDGNEKLTYKVSLSMGSLKKNHQFILYFQEKGLAPWTLCERRLESRLTGIGAKIASIEQAVQANSENNKIVGKHMHMLDSENEGLKEQMSNFEKRMLEKFEILERRVTSLEEIKKHKYADAAYVDKIVSRLEQKMAEKLEQIKKSAVVKPVVYDELTFNTTNNQTSTFTFSNNNKTAEVSTALFDLELTFSKPFPRAGKFSLSLKLEKVEHYIFIGIISEHNFNKLPWHQNSFYYFTENGYIYGGIPKPPQKSSISFGKTGDILSMEVDVDLGIVSFLVNKVEVNYFYIDLKSSRYAPYCGFGQYGCKVTIV